MEEEGGPGVLLVNHEDASRPPTKPIGITLACQRQDRDRRRDCTLRPGLCGAPGNWMQTRATNLAALLPLPLSTTRQQQRRHPSDHASTTKDSATTLHPQPDFPTVAMVTVNCRHDDNLQSWLGYCALRVHFVLAGREANTKPPLQFRALRPRRGREEDHREGRQRYVVPTAAPLLVASQTQNSNPLGVQACPTAPTSSSSRKTTPWPT